VKNRQRWTFGGLYPEAYCKSQYGSDAASNQTECLVHGTRATRLQAVTRFLHLTARVVGEVDSPLAEWPKGATPAYRPVETLRIGNRLLQSWQEAEKCEVELGERMMADLLMNTQRCPFSFPGSWHLEPVTGSDATINAVLVREQQALEGAVEISAVAVEEELFRVTLRVVNLTPLEAAASDNRDEALLRSLASTHTILGVEAGEFVSLLDPPDRWRAAAAMCCNVGTWPALVGEKGQCDTMLSSPIILYDYPEVAPESPGDFFDGTEIDEMLTLRILTLTDEEKRAMAAVDDRTRKLLARTETLAREQMRGLHGTLRNVRPLE
jgi:hypothetical protein